MNRIILFDIQAAGLREHFDPIAVWLSMRGEKVVLAIIDSEFDDYIFGGTLLGVQCIRQSSFFAAPYLPSAVLCFHPETGSRLASSFKNTRIPRIVMQHGLSDKLVFSDTERVDPLSDFSAVFLIGPTFREGSLATYAKKYPGTFSKLTFHETGSPKTDGLFKTYLGERRDLLVSLNLDPSVPTVCYGPTWEKYASLEMDGINIIKRLAEQPINLIIKLHHASLSGDKHDWVISMGHGGKNWRNIILNLELNYPNIKLVSGQDASPYLRVSDILVSDASGLAYEFLLLNKPIIFYDVPRLFNHYGRNGIHYWGRDCGDIAGNTDDLVAFLRLNIDDPSRKQSARIEWIKKVSYAFGNATEKTGIAVLDLIECPEGRKAPDSRCEPEFVARVENLNDTGFYFSNSNKKVLVSIIIPTFNRSKFLSDCLISFLNQSLNADSFEIIVVDNNSSDDTRLVLASLSERYGNLRWFFEPRQGVHYARNRAATLANGEFLYFTDDDMIADVDLIEELVNIFSTNDQVGVATSKILPIWEVPPPSWVVKHLSNMWLSLNDLGDSMIISENDIGAFSCNLAIRKNAFFMSNGFHPENTAGEWIGDGETGLNNKLKSLGWLFGYSGRVSIKHRIPESRMTQDYINKRMQNQGNCDSYSEYRKERPSDWDLLDKIRGYPNVIAGCVSLALNQKSKGDDAFHLSLARMHYWLARGIYDLKLVQDPLWREMVLREDWLLLERKYSPEMQPRGETFS